MDPKTKEELKTKDIRDEETFYRDMKHLYTTVCIITTGENSKCRTRSGLLYGFRINGSRMYPYGERLYIAHYLYLNPGR